MQLKSRRTRGPAGYDLTVGLGVAATLLLHCFLDVTTCAGQSLNSTRYEYAESLMGTEFRIVVYASSASVADSASASAFAHARELEGRLSDWISDSELNRLSSLAGSDSCASASPDLLAVLSRAQHFAQLSGGSFDVTVGPLTRLWRRAIRRGELPHETALQNALESVGYQKLSVDTIRKCVHLSAPDMRLDLGGIAKGYAADEMLKTLRSQGLSMVLVDAGGDIVVGEPPPGNPGWRVETSTVGESGDIVSENVTVSNAAVASSGDRYRFLEVDAVRYSHLVDPLTGRGITARRLVTVVAPSGAEADALASAISVMGSKGLRLADKPGRGARLIELTDNGAHRLEVALLNRTIANTSAHLPAGP